MGGQAEEAEQFCILSERGERERGGGEAYMRLFESAALPIRHSPNCGFHSTFIYRPQIENFRNARADDATEIVSPAP